ncbi:MAG: T9SS type A sorting domain-containing protein [bacterium]|nr:T9SS type A sorting domain-containing protein [bacterium]
MKKFLFLLILVNFGTLHSQPCSTRTYSPTWDWREDIPSPHKYNTYIRKNLVSNQVDLPSPFYDGTNSNTLLFALENIKDYQPENGWVVITAGLGKCSTPGNCSYAEAVDHPYFILYNKYTSVLRIFANIIDPQQNYQSAFISVNFYDPQNNIGHYESALLNQHKPISEPLDNFVKLVEMQAINFYNNTESFWLYADFPVAYDPCTCKDMPIIQFKISLKSVGTISLNLNTVTTQLVDNSGFLNPSLDFKSIISYVAGIGEAGAKSLTNTQNAIDNFDKTISTMIPSLHSKMDADKAVFLQLLALVPKVGAMVGVFDYFASGGKENDKENIKPIVYETKGALSGNISYTSIFSTPTITLPGSNNSNIQNNTLVPEYNNILGVFNLIESPILERISYKLCTNCGSAGNFSIPPIITEYKVKEDLKYVLNPASDLEIINFDVAVIMEYEGSTPPVNFDPYGIASMGRPIEFGPPSFPITPYDQRITETTGLEIEYWDQTYPAIGKKVRLRTPYIPVGCFPNQSFVLEDGQPPKFYCKIILRLRRKDWAVTNAQDLTYVFTYPFKQENSTTYNNEEANVYILGQDVNNPKFFVTGFKSGFNINNLAFMPVNGLTLPKVVHIFPSYSFTPNSEILAKDEIYIHNGVIVPNNLNIKFRANKLIDVEPLVDLGYGTELLMGLSDCYDRTVAEQTNVEISNFCRDQLKYKNFIASGPVMDPTLNINNTEFLLEFKIFPNPNSSDILNLQFESLSDYNVFVAVSDISGSVIKKMDLGMRHQGPNKIQINTEDLPPGVYLIAFEANGYLAYKKFIKL